jgi:hypothetical protein
VACCKGYPHFPDFAFGFSSGYQTSFFLYCILVPEDGCMKPKHVVEEEEENKELHIYGPT